MGAQQDFVLAVNASKRFLQVKHVSWHGKSSKSLLILHQMKAYARSKLLCETERHSVATANSLPPGIIWVLDSLMRCERGHKLRFHTF
jgi:hypothetical protein